MWFKESPLFFFSIGRSYTARLLSQNNPKVFSVVLAKYMFHYSLYVGVKTQGYDTFEVPIYFLVSHSPIHTSIPFHYIHCRKRRDYFTPLASYLGSPYEPV